MARNGGQYTDDPTLAALAEHEDWVEWKDRTGLRSHRATTNGIVVNLWKMFLRALIAMR